MGNTHPLSPYAQDHRDGQRKWVLRTSQITKKLGVPIFFADPYAAWQKGAVEHANKLIRQYIPKNTDFSNISQKDIDKYIYLINARPRQKLNFKSPAQVFFEHLD